MKHITECVLKLFDNENILKQCINIGVFSDASFTSLLSTLSMLNFQYTGSGSWKLFFYALKEFFSLNLVNKIQDGEGVLNR